ncbi:uncharacterized protein LOC103942689 [Pyrus x bretschneideri]|uniref:uncharacterized protein LOC103942689 n=1 Tax=Pyrus x bretschneideri TaxID=225117 RepID=UPI00202DFF02|nr:uncharacterized protein LOC103942689 [Pyrus x bretschneideri]
METHDDEIDNHDTTASCTSATTWTVAGGSLENCVSFESSLSPIDDETPKSTPASSLILHPPSPDSGPCEITVNFTQKHEVQQVYVRSTARVYEIYYAPDMQSGNEYLCTVRCGIAARDEDMLHTGDNEGVRSANSNGSNGSLKDPSEDKSRNGNSLNNSEDDWVEVKVSETNMLDNKVNSSQLKLQSAQEFYEATAQISDASPCVSLTLRLLSLERKIAYVLVRCMCLLIQLIHLIQKTKLVLWKIRLGVLSWPCLCLLFYNFLKQGVLTEHKTSQFLIHGENRTL